MKGKKYLLFLFFLILSGNAFGEEITVYALEAMPYCGVVKGIAQGIAIDILNEAANYGAPSFTFRFDIPWKRAQSLIQDQDEGLSAIIPFSFSEQRKGDYTWISLLCSRHFRLYSLTDWNLREYGADFSVGLVRGHVLIDVLDNLGWGRIDSGAENAEANMRKLALGRVDGVADSDLIALYYWNKVLKDRRPLYEGEEIGDANDIYIASGSDFPEDIARQIDHAVDLMRADGKIDEIIDKWIR